MMTDNANISKAVLLMKRNTDPEQWKRAQLLLDDVQKGLQGQPQPDQMAALAFALGVSAALRDDLDAAKSWLGIARSSDDSRDDIKQALEIVNKG